MLAERLFRNRATPLAAEGGAHKVGGIVSEQTFC